MSVLPWGGPVPRRRVPRPCPETVRSVSARLTLAEADWLQTAAAADGRTLAQALRDCVRACQAESCRDGVRVAGEG